MNNLMGVGVSQSGQSSPTAGGNRGFAAMLDEANSGKGGCSAPRDGARTATVGLGDDATASLLAEIKEVTEALRELTQILARMGGTSGGGSDRISGASSPDGKGGISPVDKGSNGLGGVQGPSDRIPEPTQDLRELALGGKTLRIGSDGGASAEEVDAAAAEIQRMYQTSPTLRNMVDSAPGDTVTVTVGRRGDNISWGGGMRVFLNLNNLRPGANETFQQIVGHEMGHALAGLGHGAQLDSVTKAVGREA